MRSPGERVDFEHPANAAVLACLGRLERRPSYVRDAPRGAVDEWELGAHPDLVSVLWDELDASLPKQSAWIVHGRPVLVRPKIGVLFGFVTGTQPVVLRIPAARHVELGLDERSTLRLLLPLWAECEPDWVSTPFARVRELGLIAYEASAC